MKNEHDEWMRENVDRGIKILDRQLPLWRQKINIESLNMIDGECCIIGQLFGEYSKGLDELDELEDDHIHCLAQYFGFALNTREPEYWKYLRDIWIEALQYEK